VIRLFLELSFELTLICALRAYTYDNDTGYEKAFTYSAIIVLVALVLFTYAIALLIVNNRPYLAKRGKFKKEREELERKYGTVWEDIDVHKRIGVMSTPYFMMSRFFFVMALIFYQDVVIF
jgi:membrane protein YdbS with pleckstrin-like domain